MKKSMLTKKLVLGDAPPLVASAPSPVHHPEPASFFVVVENKLCFHWSKQCQDVGMPRC
jgi:hypothetical protein